MNERIRELLIEAREQTKEGKWNAPTSVWAEKFAELILQDIDKIVDSLYHALPLEQASVLLTLDENIKEHFYGVKNERYF